MRSSNPVRGMASCIENRATLAFRCAGSRIEDAGLFQNALRIAFFIAVMIVVAGFFRGPAARAAAIVVYDDDLRAPFEDWSWATHDLHATAYVHAGTASISMTPVNWSGLYFHHPGIEVADNGTLELWVNGGTAGGQQIRFYLYRGSAPLANAELESFLPGGVIAAGTWAKATIPFSALGVTSGSIDGLIFQADAASSQPVVYFDDLFLLDTAGPPQPVTVSVDPNADRRPINPLIYGVNFGNASEFGAVGYPLRRWGGNSVTRYNWRKDATNHASDWFFINLPEGPDSTGLPAGSSADLWIGETLAAGSEAILTVPTIGWTTRDRVKRWGFSVAKYGPQQETECTASGWPSWCAADAGNGVHQDGTPITGNDPHDTSIEVGPTFVSDWVRHILGRVGTAQSGGVAYYALDNEPMLWNSTHRDVHPNPTTLDETWTFTQSYAEAIKAVDPSAQVLGPVVWGWCAYLYSALDGCAPGSDMASHGNLPLLEWYLMKNHEREVQTGVRPVDYLDVHYYPQASRVALTDDESVAATRLRSLRGLYDPAYVDESWIGQPVRLIPRMKEWIAARCPGVKLAITEYNWGGDQGISSALAQAEALAIFGREGVDLATRWVAPESPSKVLQAFRLYLDYDGAGGRLAGESVRAQSSNVDAVGSYAIRMADGRLALLLFNKAAGTRTTQVSVSGGGPGQAHLYRFDAGTSLGPAGQMTFTGAPFSLDLPARSATLILLPSVVTGVAGGGAGRGAGGTLTVTARPSLFRGWTRIRIDACDQGIDGGREVEIDIHDAAGRLVRRIEATAPRTGTDQSIEWDGRDRSGKVAPAGIYFLRARSGEYTGSCRLLKLE
jgi:hypothetical protein